MCGIAGIYNINVSVNALLDAQAYRGPDAKAAYEVVTSNNKKLSLGHNRLKIIDLSDEANQPYTDNHNNYVLVFNGEIYNYLELKKDLETLGIQFSTTSDTEVLFKSLIYWGMEALEKINGMFAFAFFDRKKEQLYLARDRFGVKPFYYYLQGEQLIFASTSGEIARQLKLKPNLIYLQKGLQYGIYEDGSEDTQYKKLNHLQPGHYLQLSLKNGLVAKKIQYYSLPERVTALRETINGWSEYKLLEYLGQRLMRSCEYRLRADVPVAVALSGGLDSSTVAAFAKEQKAHLHAFCFGDPKDTNSEALLAGSLAKRHEIDCHFVTPDDSEWETGFWETLAHQDAPFAGISVVAQYLLYKKIHQHDVRVVLGGQGGDEGFLGYRKFHLFFLRELIEKKNWLKALQCFINMSQMLVSERARLKTFWQLRSKYTKSRQTVKHFNLSSNPVHLSMGYSGDIFGRQIDDILKYSLPTLLRYEDRNSMAHSIESRLPFMDYQLIELACALPTSLKLKKGYGKWAIRHLTETRVPDNIRLAKYKKGFDISRSDKIFHALAQMAIPYIQENSQKFDGLLSGLDIPEYFAPEQLKSTPARFTELSTLCWLGEKL